MMIDELRTDGIAFAQDWLRPHEVVEVFEHLMDRTIQMGGHVTKYAGGGPTTREFMADQDKHAGNSLGCYDLETAATCPHLMPKALNYLSLAEEYFSEEALIYSVNLWWSLAGGAIKPEVQAWHRDVDDRKFLAMFFYLTRVGKDEAHYYARGSHKTTTEFSSNDGNVVGVVGEPGIFFIEDGYGFHMGMHPNKYSRLAAWARFGVSDPPLSYGVDGLHPVENEKLFSQMTGKERRATKLLVKGKEHETIGLDKEKTPNATA
jgi:hypothetical protein